MNKRLKPWRTVRGRLLLAAILVEGLMLTLLVSNSLRLLHGHMTEQAQRHAEQIAPVLIAALVAPLAQHDQATVQAVLDESRTSKGIAYLAMLDAHGKPLAFSGWNMETPLPQPDQHFSILSRETPRYDVAVPVTLAGQALGSLRFGLDLSQIVAAQRQLLTQGVTIAIVELLLSAGLLLVLGFWLTRHLSELTRVSSEVAAGNLTPRTVHEGNDDIGRLGAAFNAMSRTIAERVGELTAARDAQAALASRLEQEHSRMVALLGVMEAGILFVAPDGQVVYENPSFRKIWRINPAQICIGRSLTDVFASMPAAHHDNDNNDGQQELTLPDGRILKQRCQAVAGLDRQPMGWLWIYEDVTTAQLAARELRLAKDAAEAGSRAKAVFLANMSHEVRTPMNGIMGMTDLVLSTPLNDEQREYMTWVQSSAQSLLTILNDILDFSKIEAGRLNLEKIPFSVSHLLDEVIGVFSGAAAQKGVALRWQAGNSFCDEVHGDPVRLKQVLNNLISNALKFTEHGHVDIQVSGFPCASGKEIRLSFAIADSGTGIPADRLEHIFTPFTQADSSITRKFGGTGLGLTIVQSLVEMMGGSISVQSTLNVGSIFRFDVSFKAADNVVLPGAESSATLVAEDSTTAGANRRETALRPHTHHILLVEDTPVNQRVGQALLEKAGYRVTLAGDGLEAVASAKQARFDVILMDMQMPNMDGLEATRQIRALEAGQPRTPIIALTANAMASDRESCLAAGMDDFMSKPFHAEEMFTLITRWVARKEA
jgi:signal transduction histidine kinase/CheY-like chemotaxis protein